MKDYNFGIEAILEEELFTSPPLMRVVVAKLVGAKQDITKVFKLTKDLTPLTELRHLRRVRYLDNGEIESIVCKLTKNGDDPSEDATELERIEEKLRSENILRDYRIVKVPSKAPRTEQQLKACSDIWPSKFSKSNYLIKCIEGSVFDDNEKLVVRIITNHLLEYLMETGSNYTSGAVIFRYAKVHGLGLSCCNTVRANPTKHSSMVAIDSVAKNAGAGHWADRGQDACTLMDSLNQRLDHRPELSDHKMEADFLPYICTNYDIIVTEEPCMMCTMGLIQSRIRRLFYLDMTSLQQVIGTGVCEPVCYPDKAIEKFLVHRDKNINHRFEAWRIKLIA